MDYVGDKANKTRETFLKSTQQRLARDGFNTVVEKRMYGYPAWRVQEGFDEAYCEAD